MILCHWHLIFSWWIQIRKILFTFLLNIAFYRFIVFTSGLPWLFLSILPCYFGWKNHWISFIRICLWMIFWLRRLAGFRHEIVFCFTRHYIFILVNYMLILLDKCFWFLLIFDFHHWFVTWILRLFCILSIYFLNV